MVDHDGDDDENVDDDNDDNGDDNDDGGDDNDDYGNDEKRMIMILKTKKMMKLTNDHANR